MPSIAISKTKIIPPKRRKQLLTRKRLLEFMYEALDKKLTLISAPAGYGKTSLLIDLIHDEGNDWKNCWLALDELDREPQRFATYFIASITQQFPEFGKQSKDVLENMKSFDQDMERLLVTMINELIENINELFIIMLDDFQLVEEVQSIKKFINRFIQLMPENCRIVISSRKLADLPELTRLIAHGDANGIDFDELAFQAEEIQRLIAQNENRHISDEEAKRLATETEGWITGLQFSNIKLPSSGDQSNLFNYFKQQVLDLQAPELREFILRTSLFEEFDAKLCESVLQPLYSKKQDWQALIKNTASNNAFALPVGENGNWLRYHHLFRDFIREQFKIERPNEVNPLLSNLQLAYEARNEWEKAHYICRQLNDTKALAEMIERASTYMMQNAQILIVESWLKDLPSAMLKRPGILSIRGAIALPKDELQESLQFLNEAEEKFRLDHNINGLVLALLRRVYTQRILGDYEAGLADANEIIDLTKEASALKPLYAEALRVKGAMLVRMGQTRQAVKYFENSLQLYESLNEIDSIPFLLVELGVAYRAFGEYEQVKKLYERALQLWQQTGNVFLQANLLNNFGVFYHFLGQYEDAAFAFEEGLLCVQRSKGIRTEALIYISFGEMYAELEDFEMANQSYEHAAEIIKTLSDRYLNISLTFAQANLAFLQKNSVSAHKVIEVIKDSILNGGSNYEIGFLNLIYGRLAVLEKKFSKAIEKLKQAEKYFVDDGRSVEINITRIWLAAALHQNKKSSEAVELINSLPSTRGKLFHTSIVAGHQAYDWLFGLNNGSTAGRLVRELFTQVDKFSKELPFIRRQVKRQAQVVSKLVPKIEIRAFGNPIVSIDGKTLTTSDWQTQAVRDLFFYFLTTNKPLTKEQIVEFLWPDTYERHKLNLRFKNDIYRLRKAVGQNVIFFENDLYRFNHNLDYEYDVEAFEKYVANAKKSRDVKQKIDFYQRAIDLVHAPYLNDVFAEWTTSDREHLGQEHLKALIELADLYQTDGQPENAIRIFEKIITIDPGNEKAYQIAMKAYYRLQDRAAIIRLYQACKKAMKKLFNFELSQETEELYGKLKK